MRLPLKGTWPEARNLAGGRVDLLPSERLHVLRMDFSGLVAFYDMVSGRLLGYSVPDGGDAHADNDAQEQENER